MSLRDIGVRDDLRTAQRGYRTTAPVRHPAALDCQDRVVGAIEAFRVRSPQCETDLPPAVVHQLDLSFGQFFVASPGSDGADLANITDDTKNVWSTKIPIHNSLTNYPGSVTYPWKWNEWCFRQRFCTRKAILGRGQLGLMRWILSWIVPLVQDRTLDLLTSSPAHYHCTMDAPTYPWRSGRHGIHCLLIKPWKCLKIFPYQENLFQAFPYRLCYLARDSPSLQYWQSWSW